MIEYIVSTNIDDRVLVRSARILSEGGLLGIPSDTSWIVVCSLRSKEGIKKLRKISGERDERHFTLLCSDISQFGDFCSMNNTQFRLLKRLSPGPYVFILKTLLGTEKTLQLRRGEIGVRIPDHPVPVNLIKTLGSPLYSVTAKRSMTDEDAPIPAETRHDGRSSETDQLPPIPEEDLFEGGWELEAIAGLDLILDTGEERPRIFSTILDISGGEIMSLRKGAGAWPV
ncbi:MAG: L-threonylcarbamoyladenylate synthase [Treponema sp.]|jgi:tRNA threonylcarbamoyl adenosine modification protein (Sua5/YciO/YrdC/YwlC family)|nr:L-threonylcarbamoyladenylate synthase [Treponema sp.]